LINNDDNHSDKMEDENMDDKCTLLLKQRELELCERDCEQLRRENALLQSWL